jgi:tRNA threonylcarbamoyladenosine biosynthesis protein TsaB
LDRPLIAINTLQAMALQLAPFFPGHLLCPMIDARRMEVYTAVFNDQNQFVQETRAVIMNAESFQDLLANSKVVFSATERPNASHYFRSFQCCISRNGNQTISPDYRKLAAIAFENAQFEDVATFEPYYLKDFMAPCS